MAGCSILDKQLGSKRIRQRTRAVERKSGWLEKFLNEHERGKVENL